MHKSLLVILYNNAPDALKLLVKKAEAVKEDWNSELHDTKIIAAEVLKNLGSEWQDRVITLAREHSDELPYEYHFRKDPVPAPGKNRTRMFKYMIKEVLDQLYENDGEFKYFKKYNSPNGIYITWKWVGPSKSSLKPNPNPKHSRVTAIKNRVPDISYDIKLPHQTDALRDYLENQFRIWTQNKPTSYKKGYCKIQAAFISNLLHKLQTNNSEISLHIYAINAFEQLDGLHHEFSGLYDQLSEISHLNSNVARFFNWGYDLTDRLQIMKAVFQDNFAELNEQALPDDHIIPNLWESFVIHEKEMEWLLEHLEPIRKVAQRNNYLYFGGVEVWPAYYRMKSVLETYRKKPYGDMVLAIHPYESFCFEQLSRIYRDSLPKRIIKMGLSDSELEIPRKLEIRLKEQFSPHGDVLKRFLSTHGRDYNTLKLISAY